MKELFLKMRDAIACGKDTVLCTIIASSGSAPRGSGAKMAVFADGSTCGTIGGGAVEHESIRLAQHALSERAAFTHGFHLAPNQVADIGMICGGQVVVQFQFFAGGDAQALSLFSHIAALFGREKDAWLVTKLADGAAACTGIYEKGAGLLHLNDVPEEAVLPLLRPRAVLQKEEQGRAGYYVEPLTRAEIVYVFGGGHVSAELVPLLAHVGFSVAVYEDRAEFGNAARFPDAVRIIRAPFEGAGTRISITPDDAVVIMTRGHQGDFVVLEQMLRTQAGYIGVIGSRHKIAATNRRLMEAGIPEAALGRIHTPIGLDIGAETPAEIAISIAAELIAHRAQSLKEAL